jgi:hypothetical protein
VNEVKWLGARSAIKNYENHTHMIDTESTPKAAGYKTKTKTETTTKLAMCMPLLPLLIFSPINEK